MEVRGGGGGRIEWRQGEGNEMNNLQTSVSPSNAVAHV